MTSAEPSLLLAVGSLILGLAASVLWTITGHLILIAHEGSHALFGSLTGGPVTSMTLRMNGNGLTQVRAPNKLLFWVSGYLGPSLFGLTGATALAHGANPEAVLWVAFILMVLTFIQVRNFFGFFIVSLYGALFFVLARYGAPDVRALSAYTLVWFLLLGGVLQNALTKIRIGDASDLKSLTMLPIGFWTMLWWMANTAALIYGGGVLLRLIAPPLG